MGIQRVARHKRARIRVGFKQTKTGVTRIVRDSYSNVETSWYEIAKKVRTRDGNQCTQCHCTEHLHVHHIKPLEEGGRTVMSNLITLCENCHKRRHKHMR